MTISTQTARAQYAGNGVTTSFAVPFEFLTASPPRVIYTVAGVDTPWVLTTNYTLTGGGAQQPATGSIVALVAPPLGSRITILRNEALTQAADYVPNDPFPATAHEKALDRLSMQNQMIAERLGRSIGLKESSATTGITIGEPEAGKVIGWNSDGTALESKAVSTVGEAFPTTANRYIRRNLGGSAFEALTAAQVWSDLSDTRGLAQALTGFFDAADGARIHKMTDRVFISDGALFGGEFGNYADYTGLDPLPRALHNWGPRDANLYVDSSTASMAIVGHSQASKVSPEWPAYPTFNPASIGVSGFAINDRSDGLGVAWGMYSDTTVMPGAGFSVSLESAIGNFDAEVTLTPYNYLAGGSKGGIGHWIQSGNGFDVVNADLANASLSAWNVNHATAGTVYLSSYATGSVTGWVTAHAYSVGDWVSDPQTDIVFRCSVAHTSSGVDFASYRAANPTRWKQRPGFRKGIVFTAGALAELAAGANIFSPIEMTERSQISWWRKNGSGNAEESAYVMADTIPDGSAVVGLTFQLNQLLLSNGNLTLDKTSPTISSTATNASLTLSANGTGKIHSTNKWGGNADGTVGAKIEGRGTANALSFNWTGTQIQIFVDNVLVKTI